MRNLNYNIEIRGDGMVRRASQIALHCPQTKTELGSVWGVVRPPRGTSGSQKKNSDLRQDRRKKIETPIVKRTGLLIRTWYVLAGPALLRIHCTSSTMVSSRFCTS